MWGWGLGAARCSIFSLESLQVQILIWNLPFLKCWLIWCSNIPFLNYWKKNWVLVKLSPHDQFVTSNQPRGRCLILFIPMNNDSPRQDSESRNVFGYPLTLPFSLHSWPPSHTLRCKQTTSVVSSLDLLCQIALHSQDL